MALTCARTCAAALFTAAQTRNQDALQQAPRGTSRPWDVTQGSKEMSSYAVEETYMRMTKWKRPI